jgi:formylglycine-generating enzyme required for sulfatase activity
MRKDFELFAAAGVAHPCCVPSRQRAGRLAESRQASAERKRVTGGSTEEMIKLDGGAFLMGTDSEQAFPHDGEGPVRKVLLDPFFIDRYAVTSAQFGEFVQATGYQTESERLGWSFVFQGHIPEERRKELVAETVPGASWWCKINDAAWNHPEGPDSDIMSRAHHPVTHVSWNDATAYADWAGKRLPTEAEWEFASRGGLEQKIFPWGDELTPNGEHRCNVWQGEFPLVDLAEDGYAGPAPVDSFPPNDYGLYNITGNVWEWCSDWFHPSYHLTAARVNPLGPARGRAKVMKGGSYLCHHSYCNRYRVAARTSNEPDSATTNIGFRCVRDVA